MDSIFMVKSLTSKMLDKYRREQLNRMEHLDRMEHLERMEKVDKRQMVERTYQKVKMDPKMVLFQLTF